MLHKGDRKIERDRAHTGARDLPQSEPSHTTERDTSSPPPKEKWKLCRSLTGVGTGMCLREGGSGGQPGAALERQKDRDGQRPAEDRHAAAVEARLGTIEGGFTWGDLGIGVRPGQKLDQHVAVLVEVRGAFCKKRKRWKWILIMSLIRVCLFSRLSWWGTCEGQHSLGHGSMRQTRMVSGLLSRHRPMVSLVWHRACRCCVPLPHVTEHWKYKKTYKHLKQNYRFIQVLIQT